MFDELQSAIEDRLRSGDSARSIARRSGLPLRAVQNILEGHQPSLDRAAKICEVLGLEAYIGPPRLVGDSAATLVTKPVFAQITALLSLPHDASPEDVVRAMDDLIRTASGGDDKALREAVSAETASLRAELETISAKIEALTDASALVSDYEGEDPLDARPVDVLELASAAGGGAEVLSEEVSGRVWFRRSWLDGHGLNASRCAVIGVAGESMEPTLMDGSKILIDRQRTRRRSGDVFVIAAPDGLVVKRAGEDADGRALMVSDNPAWEVVAWPDEAEIIGRVVWTAKTLEGW